MEEADDRLTRRLMLRLPKSTIVNGLGVVLLVLVKSTS